MPNLHLHGLDVNISIFSGLLSELAVSIFFLHELAKVKVLKVLDFINFSHNVYNDLSIDCSMQLLSFSVIRTDVAMYTF